MNPYQVLYKNDIVILVNLLEENSSEEVKTLCDQGFTLHESLIEAKDKEVALAIYNSQKPNLYTKYKKVGLGVLTVFAVLYGAGFIRGLEFQYTKACQNLGSSELAAIMATSLLPMAIDNMSDMSSLPIYRQGLASGLKYSIGECIK